MEIEKATFAGGCFWCMEPPFKKLEGVAEEYHQEYYKKNPAGYKLYRSNSGRDPYLEKLWGKVR